MKLLGANVEKAMAPHSSALAWKSPWTEEPGGLQSMGSRRVAEPRPQVQEGLEPALLDPQPPTTSRLGAGFLLC